MAQLSGWRKIIPDRSAGQTESWYNPYRDLEIGIWHDFDKVTLKKLIGIWEDVDKKFIQIHSKNAWLSVVRRSGQQPILVKQLKTQSDAKKFTINYMRTQ